MIEVVADETQSTLCNGKLLLIQKKDGYRFSMDSILLANFIRLKKNERVLDIGVGCGIIPIYLRKKGFSNPMLGVEIQEEQLLIAARNRDLNGCADMEFIGGDIMDLEKTLKRTPFHVIVSNPPFIKTRSGRINPGISRRISRQETTLRIDSLVSAVSSLLFKKGRFYVIYPTKRLGELIYTAAPRRLELKRLRLIHPRKGDNGNLFLAEFIKEGGVQVIVEKPLYIYDNDQYTDEISSYYSL